MAVMLNQFHKLKEIKGINKFYNNKVTDISNISNDCFISNYLDLSNFITSNDTYIL